MSEAETGSDPGADPGRESDPGANPETEPDSGATSDPAVWGGKRFVILIYVALVAVTGVFGYIIGLARPENLDPRLLGVISLPPTPAGVALYGMLTVALVLGVLLLAVNYVSQRYDTAAVDGGEQE
ncbi:DUF7520 family protein [Salinirussus salinus]|jgi:hypothetical protein|uniref:DUF7520 family protein n=1 Tax=Salinirussus salinus TaxID=1198300 RepID=UPI001F1D9082|nr:hypothetical protein [Salinirussus salinus]